MHNMSGQRSITFTGCWTCKARKVRCDEKPVSCGNCEKRGITCGGYGIKLQWVSDPYADPTTSIAGRGRRKIELDQTGGHRYTMQEIDEIILTADNGVQGRLPFRKGPFYTFAANESSCEAAQKKLSPYILAPARCPTKTSADASQYSEESDGVSPINNNQSDANESSSQITPVSDSGDGIHDIEAFVDYDVCVCTDLAIDLEEFSREELDAQEALPEIIDVNELSFLIPQPRLLSDQSKICHSGFSESDKPYKSAIQHINSSLFGDLNTDGLMHHYIMNVADVLQPIRHLHNIYRDLYVPTALEGSLGPLTDSRALGKDAHSAIYHALLASAALHLRNCNRFQPEFEQLGNRHKAHALRHLQTAVGLNTSQSNYRNLLMAMLAVLTIGIISGEGNDFTIHLQGQLQLRRSRRKWRLISTSTRNLIGISAFLTLMARTTSFQVFPSLLGEDLNLSKEKVSVHQSSIGYWYMFGITPFTAAAIEETCRLAESLSRLGAIQEEVPIPDHILDDCESLGNRILSCDIEYEINNCLRADDDETRSIFGHHARAWHYAALIYYYRRIQNFDSADLVEGVENICENMLAVEKMKAASSCDSTRKMAPITWPMFVASCDAVGSNRENIRRWWEIVQHYGIANLERQWVVVQRIWADLDESPDEYPNRRNWIDVYRDLDITLHVI